MEYVQEDDRLEVAPAAQMIQTLLEMEVANVGMVEYAVELGKINERWVGGCRAEHMLDLERMDCTEVQTEMAVA